MPDLPPPTPIVAITPAARRPAAAQPGADPPAVRQPSTPATVDLARYRWKRRVLVLFAPDTADPAFAAEEAALTRRTSGVAERDLVIVRVLDAGQSTVDGQAVSPAAGAALRTRLRADAGRFTAVLVGKDGNVALRSHTPVVAGRLFPTIDAMPMRRDEARRRSGPGGGAR